jgi:hypothetical protein
VLAALDERGDGPRRPSTAAADVGDPGRGHRGR